MTGETAAEDAKHSASRPARGLFGRPYLFGLILAAVGVVLIWGGVRLVSLGGSPYYLVVGLAVAASAVMAWLGRWLSARIYFALLLGTTVWAIWEGGDSSWALVARLAAPTVLGLWFLVPWTRRRLAGPEHLPWLRSAGLFVVAIAVGTVLHLVAGRQLPDPMYQVGAQAEAPARTGSADGAPGSEWRAWGGTVAGQRFSSLDQITPANVGNLELAWVYRFGEAPPGAPAALETTPLKIGNRLYACTDYNDVVSLDAETGEEVWRFRANVDLENKFYAHCRGVTYYEVPEATGFCSRRIYTNTIDARLLAIDAATGRLCTEFGENGAVDLLRGMSDAPPGYYIPTSAPTLARGRLVLGGWISDGQFWGSPSGVIRAFDAVTGELSWAFDMGNPDRTGEPAEGETYTPGTPNAWAPMSYDDELGLVFAPLGGTNLDYSSENRRPFDRQYSGSVVALDIETGRPRWSFQTVHDDRWDYDVASQPSLVDFPTADGPLVAVLQPTKRGEIFVLNRATGEPIMPVTEEASPASGLAPGETIPPTQPYSHAMPSFRGRDVTERSMWGLTPLDQMMCRIAFREARYDGPLTAPGLTPSIVFPGMLGGMNWGGAAIDPERNLAIFTSNYVANHNQLIPREDVDRMGVKPMGMGGQPTAEGTTVQPQLGTTYGVRALPFMSPLFVPCQQPPWSRISAVDLTTRRLVWSHPLGTGRDSGPLGIPSMLPFKIGTPHLGGSVITRGGLIFIGATQDHYLRAIDAGTGDVLWRARLGAGPQANPMTYYSDESGRQFVVIAAGGHAFLGTTPGDYLYAFALPREAER